MTLHRRTAGRAALEVDLDDGGRWSSLEVDGLQLLSGADVQGVPASVRHGCFAMAPYAGRLGHGVLDVQGSRYQLPRDAPPHAIHGHVHGARWQLDADGAVTTRLGDPWPFAGTVRQELQLHEDGLDARLVLQAEQEMPATLGYHPWFPKRLGGADVALHLAAEQMYEKDDEDLPTGRLVPRPEGPYDDCFPGVTTPPRLVWPGVLTLTLTATTDHWVVFDQRDDVICVEPQTGPPDAIALDRAQVVPAGGELALELRLRWQ